MSNFLIYYLLHLKYNDYSTYATVINDYNACIVLFNTFDSKTKKYIYRMLHSKENYSYVDESNNNKESIDMMLKIGVLDMIDGYIFINDTFQSNLLSFLFTNNTITNNTYILTNNSKYNDFLQQIVLYHHDNSNTNTINLSTIIHDFNLVDDNHKVTKTGLELLLMSKHNQLWYMVVKYMEKYLNNNTSEILEIFGLFLNSDSCSNINTMNYFYDIGVIESSNNIDKLKNSNSKNTISSALKNSDKNYHNNKFIYLESNHKIYAYTSNPCDLEILNMFSTIEYKFSNMVKCILDETKIRNSLDRGIDIAQIVEFIKYNSYYNSNILNYLYLINNNRHRIKKYDGYLLSDFANYKEYAQILTTINNKEIIYRNDEERKVFITEEEYVKVFQK